MFNGFHMQLNELRECTVSGNQGTKQGASLSVLLANTKKGKKNPTKNNQNTFFKKVLN